MDDRSPVWLTVESNAFAALYKRVASLDVAPGRSGMGFIRARPLQPARLIEPLTGQESHMIARAAAADALVLVARGERDLAAGDRAPYLRLT